MLLFKTITTDYIKIEVLLSLSRLNCIDNFTENEVWLNLVTFGAVQRFYLYTGMSEEYMMSYLNTTTVSEQKSVVILLFFRELIGNGQNYY